jgi:S1-C subfamily serine protease
LNLRPLSLAPLGHVPAVGEHVFAIGHPANAYGKILSRTLSDGIISAVGRTDSFFPGKITQITIPINFGNSGGPIFDDRGRVIAVATFGHRRNRGGQTLESLNFALDVQHVHELLNDPAQK